MEETISQSKLDCTRGIKSHLRDSFQLRPSTPLKMPSFKMDEAEKEEAFRARPKIGV